MAEDKDICLSCWKKKGLENDVLPNPALLVFYFYLGNVLEDAFHGASTSTKKNIPGSFFFLSQYSLVQKYIWGMSAAFSNIATVWLHYHAAVYKCISFPLKVHDPFTSNIQETLFRHLRPGEVRRQRWVLTFPLKVEVLCPGFCCTDGTVRLEPVFTVAAAGRSGAFWCEPPSWPGLLYDFEQWLISTAVCRPAALVINCCISSATNSGKRARQRCLLRCPARKTFRMESVPASTSILMCGGTSVWLSNSPGQQNQTSLTSLNLVPTIFHWSCWVYASSALWKM